MPASTALAHCTKTTPVRKCHTRLQIQNWALFGVLKSGDIGLAESYIAGDWSTPDLVALLHL